MLRQLDLGVNYDSEYHDLLKDFFRPSLNQTTLYQRAVGFFSLASLLNTPTALSSLVENGGRVELIIGQTIGQDDFDAIQKGHQLSLGANLAESFEKAISDHAGTLLEYRVRILAYLFSQNQLEIKFAYRPAGLFHKKIGLMTDAVGDTLAFNGSMNDTEAALDPKRNSEQITVFRSWIDGQNEYVEDIKSTFLSLWNNQSPSETYVCEIPEIVKAGLEKVFQTFPEKPTQSEEQRRADSFFKRKNKSTQQIHIPEYIGSNKFKLREYQRDALQQWQAARRKGILALATGAGKTITAIYGAVKIMDSNPGLAVIITVPRQDLGEQWSKELHLFGAIPIRAWSRYPGWRNQLGDYVNRNTLRQTEDIFIVVVTDTFKSDDFQSLLRRLDLGKTLIIGDECHSYGSEGMEGSIPDELNSRLGLSATPWDDFSDLKNARLTEAFGTDVAEFTIADAINEKFLTPYRYTAIPVELTIEETTEYGDLSKRISRKFASSANRESPFDDDSLTALLMQRARLLGSAANKLVALAELIDKQGIKHHSLVYCGDGSVEDNGDLKKQRYAVSALLTERSISNSPFTSGETAYERTKILENFRKGETSVLTAIKCLDEGIDVPACQAAYFLASSRNSRQFVQRRGRVLRKAPRKDRADLYDFVPVLPLKFKSDGSERKLLKGELKRIIEFAKTAENKFSSLTLLKPWLNQYDLELEANAALLTKNEK